MSTKIINISHLSKSHCERNGEGFSDTALDTLAQLGQNPSENGKKTLQKRGIRKWLTNEIIYPLIDLKNEREKRYWNTYHCNDVILQSEGKLTGKYCKNRFCPLCSGILTAKNINQYREPFSKYQDLQFTTLTAPTCNKEELTQTIDDRLRIFSNVNKQFRRKGNKVNGIRKLEVNPRPNGMYHPHLHILHDGGGEQGKRYIEEWLKRNPNASHKSQDTRKFTGNFVEIMKYVSKMFKAQTDKESGKQIITRYPAEQIDAILESLHHKRVIQPFGEIKVQPIEDIDELEASVYTDNQEDMIWKWFQNVGDWVNEYGEPLTNVNPKDYFSFG